MRTTLTLDDDVAALLRRVQARSKAGLKQVVNEALREGLTRLQTPAKQSRSYRTRAVDLGECLVGSLDNIGDALAVADGEDYG